MINFVFSAGSIAVLSAFLNIKKMSTKTIVISCVIVAGLRKKNNKKTNNDAGMVFNQSAAQTKQQSTTLTDMLKNGF